MAKPSWRAMARVVAESRPPASKTTALRSAIAAPYGAWRSPVNGRRARREAAPEGALFLTARQALEHEKELGALQERELDGAEADARARGQLDGLGAGLERQRQVVQERAVLGAGGGDEEL